MNALAIPLVVMIGLMLFELWVLKNFRGQVIPWVDVIFNLNSGHILMWLFRGVEIACFAWVLNYFSFDLFSSVSPWVCWVFTFFAWDFCFYWLHRLHHQWRFLWAIHEVHHQGEHYNLSLGIRNSWYSSLSSIPFFTILAVMGVPLEIFITVSSIHYAVQFYNHNDVVGHSGILERFMITPAHHRIHHGANKQYINTNYGGTFLWWDKLFGSFQPELTEVSIVYGVPKTTKTNNPFWASNLPFFRFLRLKEPNIKPGKVFPVSIKLLATGGVLLFGIVLYYIHHEGTWEQQWHQPILFTLILSATLTLGAISDGKVWGWLGWIAIGLLLAFCGLFYLPVVDIFGVLLFSTLLLHTFLSFGYVIRNNGKGIEASSLSED
ncbi:sterol desaturase family protein [Pragia fontium]|uniref:sterol desaturase family protein n=1 Tax=Pragia fontium TaxID=82985 RepID=UPI0008FFB878|nr:sterol desaturase family protein [Pragia fontium]